MQDRLKYLGETFEDISNPDNDRMVGVYECEECGSRYKADEIPRECYFCREAINRWHEEEARMDLL